MSPSQTWYKTRRRASGVVFILVLALLGWLSVAIYNKQFQRSAMVTLYTSSVGNQMHPHAEVKTRGVVVGEVREISSDGGRARLLLAIEPDQVERLPANVSAVMLPTTLFGQRSVNLLMPPDPVPARLAHGSVIDQDRSENAIELQQALDNLLPTLQAVQPQKLSSMLTAMARALEGRGDDLGNTLTGFDAYLEEMNPNLPTMNEDISELVRVSQVYDEAAPDILAAMADFTVTAQTVVEQRQDLNALYATLTGASQDLGTFLRQNQDNIIRLSADSRPTLQTLARYSREFPCTLRALTRFKPKMDRVLGAGTSQPGLHVRVNTVPSLGRYVPGRDDPVFADDRGPRCYPVPLPAIDLADGARPGAATTAERTRAPVVAPGLGLANSPQENELINELLAPTLQAPRESLPAWSSVLVGPLFRGTEVTLE